MDFCGPQTGNGWNLAPAGSGVCAKKHRIAIDQLGPANDERVARGITHHLRPRNFTHTGRRSGLRRGIAMPVMVTGTRRMATVWPPIFTMQSM